VSFTAARGRISLAFALVAAMALATPSPVAASTEFESVAQIARAQVGDRFRLGAEGPHRFDCSGLVYFAFERAGLLERVGGRRRLARGYLQWFRERGLASRSNPQPGDLVVWGRGKHIGIYLGDGKAISAIVNPYGVRVHPVKGWINMRFTTYLHVSVTR
jgi:cell wall-associated NlpC family hydrolase